MSKAQTSIAPNRWSAGVFAAKASELSRRLREWDVDDFQGPITTASEVESRECVRRTFAQTLGEVGDDDEPRPSPSVELFVGIDKESARVTGVYENPEEDTDRSLTQSLMADFARHLAREPIEGNAALDWLRESYRQLLALPAWDVRALPESLGGGQEGSQPYMVTGRTVPAAVLDALAAAGESLLRNAATAPQHAEDEPLVLATALDNVWSPYFPNFPAFRKAVVEGKRVQYQSKGRRFYVRSSDVARMVKGMTKRADALPKPKRKAKQAAPSNKAIDNSLRPEHKRTKDEIDKARRLGGH